jgi:tetratricopeptide (TPR) repeat protein
VKTSVLIFLIVSLGIVVYSNSLGNDFVWDDTAFVIENDFIKNPRLIPIYFTSKEALAQGKLAEENYRPFLPLSFFIDYFFWKLNPLGYHLTNTLFHIANAILVFFLIQALTGRKLIAVFTSLFFVTHPIQTESVTWISGRADVLFLFFYLASLILYINYTKKNRLILYFASLLSFACGLLSKEMAATLPLILILYDFFYGKKEKASLRAIRYFPYFLTLEAYLFTRFYIIGKLAQAGYWTGNAYTTMLTMAKGIVYYIGLLIYPVNLCNDYLRFPVSTSIREHSVFFSILTVIILIAGAVTLAKKFKHMSFSIFWFFITLGPAMNIIPINILIAERFLYLPSIGYCFFAATSIILLSEKIGKKPILKRSFFYCAAFLICVYSYLTMARNAEWSDSIALWKKAVKVCPDNDRAHYSLALAYRSRGKDIDMAYEEARKAIEIEPRYLHPRLITASYHISKGQREEAVKELKYAIKSDPNFLHARRFLGGIYAAQGEYDLAYNEFKKVVALDPDFLEAKVDMATLYLLKDDIDSGIKEFNKILRKSPPYHYRSLYAAIHLRLGELYFMIGDKESAIRSWRKVYEDFKYQIWFYEISKFLIGKISFEELLAETPEWQPEFKAICYYYVGIKKEIDQDLETAETYYRKSIDTPTPSFLQIKILAAKRLEKLKKETKFN